MTSDSRLKLSTNFPYFWGEMVRAPDYVNIGGPGL